MGDKSKSKVPWYIAGLGFECQQCCNCCSGPGEGYIWITQPEINILADFLKIPVEQLRRQYIKRIGLRTTIIEQSDTKDCVFLRQIDGRKSCSIYSVRPNQCRTWPFWSENLSSQNNWNRAGQRCGGINRGRVYSFEEIEKIRKSRKWWSDDKRKGR